MNDAKRTRRPKRALAWEPLLAAALLLGAGLEWISLPKPANAESYHRAVRDAAAGIPMRIGNWAGTDVPVPAGAVAMLRPNVLLSRRYVNVATGREANVLLVQCGDARDIVVHYPPVCMVNAGWTLTESKPKDWLVDGVAFTGTEYHFVMRALDRPGAIVVANFMLLPDGRVARDMVAVNDAASDVSRRYFGAAQVQVLTQADMPDEQRERTVVELVSGMKATIAAIGAGEIR